MCIKYIHSNIEILSDDYYRVRNIIRDDTKLKSITDLTDIAIYELILGELDPLKYENWPSYEYNKLIKLLELDNVNKIKTIYNNNKKVKKNKHQNNFQRKSNVYKKNKR